MPRQKRKTPPRNTITVYLLNSDVTTAEAAIATEKCPQTAKVTVAGKKRDLFVLPSKAHAPRWVSFFGGEVSPRQHHLLASAPSAVLLVPHKKRLFALTFGYGRHLLATGACEERFGLMVTLNAVDSKSLRSISKQSFDSLARLVQEQSSRAASADEFGVDMERDLLRAVTGTPRDQRFASRITGSEALVATVGFTANDLGGFLDQCLGYHASDVYKKEFDWVDHIAAVKGKELVAKLDEELVARLRSDERERLWLAAPDLLDWTGVDGFTFSTAKNAKREPDLHVGQFVASVGGSGEVSLEVLKKHHAFCWASDRDGQVIDKWSVYKCVYCEVDDDGSTYLLSSGKWYRVDRDFVSELNAYVERIASLQGLVLPDCAHLDEAEYNKEVHASDVDYYALMDRENISYGGGRSKIEVCDLLTKDRRLIHVKKYSGSSVLSHLFAQAAVSGELLTLDEGFRDRANAKLPPSHQLPEKMSPSDFEIVLAIVSWTKKKLDLPFFSRVNLRAAHRRMTGFGYRVSLATIKGPSSPKGGE